MRWQQGSSCLIYARKQVERYAFRSLITWPIALGCLYDRRQSLARDSTRSKTRWQVRGHRIRALSLFVVSPHDSSPRRTGDFASGAGEFRLTGHSVMAHAYDRAGLLDVAVHRF
jgi:hypothetical protein